MVGGRKTYIDLRKIGEISLENHSINVLNSLFLTYWINLFHILYIEYTLWVMSVKVVSLGGQV